MKYFVVLILFVNLLLANTFDVNNLKESKLSLFMSYLKLPNFEHTTPCDVVLSEKFEKIKNPNLGENFENAVWTQVKLKNSSKDAVAIHLLNNVPLTQKIDVFIFVNNKIIERKNLGVLLHNDEEYLYNRYNSFELLIQPENEYTILTKIYNPKGRINAEWIAMSQEAFHHFLFKDSIIWGVIFGILLILFVLLILFYIIFENKSFLSYLFYILLFTFYLFVDNGFSTLIFGNGELDLILSHLSRYPIIFIYILFLDEYLQLSKNKKYPILLKLVYIYSIYLALTSWVIIFSPVIYAFNKLHFLLTLATLFILLFITASESIKTKTIPIFYIFGQLSLLLGYLFLLSSSLQLIPVKASNQQFFGFFVSLEMIFFTLAIFSRMKLIIVMKEKNEKLILSQSHFSTIGQTLKNIAHQWKVPMVRLGTLITELESVFYKEKIANDRIDTIFVQMRSSTVFMQNTITEFSNFYTNDNKKVNFKIIDEINDVKVLLIEKMKFLNFEIVYDGDDIHKSELLGDPKTFAHISMIIIDNAIDISNQRHIKNPWIKISVQKNKHNLIISFEDNCQGIIQKPVESIFDLEVSSHEEENRGTGLSIAKMLVEHKMGGKISVKNSLEGAIFSLVLPIVVDSSDSNDF